MDGPMNILPVMTWGLWPAWAGETSRGTEGGLLSLQLRIFLCICFSMWFIYRNRTPHIYTCLSMFSTSTSSLTTFNCIPLSSTSSHVTRGLQLWPIHKTKRRVAWFRHPGTGNIYVGWTCQFFWDWPAMKCHESMSPASPTSGLSLPGLQMDTFFCNNVLQACSSTQRWDLPLAVLETMCPGAHHCHRHHR